jgi:hypothetical protein
MTVYNKIDGNHVFKNKAVHHKLLLVLLCSIVLSLFGLAKVKAEATTVNYKMQENKVTYKDGDLVRGIVSFEYPKLVGDSIQITKINQILENAMKAYMSDESAV